MLFDPIGFLALHVIRAKILLQEMWASGFDWHDLLQQIQGRRAKFRSLEMCNYSIVCNYSLVAEK